MATLTRSSTTVYADRSRLVGLNFGPVEVTDSPKSKRRRCAPGRPDSIAASLQDQGKNEATSRVWRALVSRHSLVGERILFQSRISIKLLYLTPPRRRLTHVFDENVKWDQRAK